MMTIMDMRCASDSTMKEVREARNPFIHGNNFVCTKVGNEDGMSKQEIT